MHCCRSANSLKCYVVRTFLILFDLNNEFDISIGFWVVAIIQLAIFSAYVSQTRAVKTLAISGTLAVCILLGNKIY